MNPQDSPALDLCECCLEEFGEAIYLDIDVGHVCEECANNLMQIDSFLDGMKYAPPDYLDL